MVTRDEALNELRLAEHQFRLACTVHLAVANEVQTLDVPVEWAFGRHRVSYEDFGLRKDQADLAAAALENTATFVVAGAVRDAICSAFPNPKAHQNSDVVAAYQSAECCVMPSVTRCCFRNGPSIKTAQIAHSLSAKSSR